MKAEKNGTDIKVEEVLRDITQKLQALANSNGAPWSAYMPLLYLYIVHEKCSELLPYFGYRASGESIFDIGLTYSDYSTEFDKKWGAKADTQKILLSFDPELGELSLLLDAIEHDQIRLSANDLESHYPELIDEAIKIIAAGGKNQGGFYDQPRELTELMLQLAGIKKGQQLYNPFAGLASFRVELPSNNYYGQEIDQRAWAIGMIRSSAHGKTAPYRYVNEDSFTQWNPKGTLCDLIVANPPFNVIRDGILPELAKMVSTESFFLNQSIAHLKPTGKAIMVAPNGFLFSSKRDQLATRQRIVDEDLLDTVISFPGGLLQHTRMPFSLIVLNKRKQRPAFVRFVQADKFIIDNSGRDMRIDAHALVYALDKGADDSMMRWVPLEEIKTNGNDLNPARYIGYEDVAEIENAEQLSNILKPLTPPRTEQGVVLPFARIRDLKEAAMEHELHAEQLELIEAPKHARGLGHSALLLAMRWSNLKPSWFKYSGTSISISSDIRAFEVNESRVFIPFLISELHRPYVREQVARMSRGLTIPNLRLKDLLSIHVELPSMEAQRAIVKGLEQAHVATQIEQAQLAADRHGVELAAFNNSASFKHLLGTPLLNLGSGVDIMSNALDKLEPKWRDRRVSAREQMTLGDIIDKMAYELERIAALLDSDSTELDVEKYPLAHIDLVSYSKKAMRRVKQEMNGGHEVSLAISADVKEQLHGKAPIMGNEVLLDIAVDAIVDNARRHAFEKATGPHKLQFQVDLIIESKRTLVTLSVANNGMPFPEDFGLDRYVRKNVHAGASGHTGIGGYHVNKVLRWHKGQLELISHPISLDGLTTSIELIFPLTQH